MRTRPVSVTSPWKMRLGIAAMVLASLGGCNNGPRPPGETGDVEVVVLGLSAADVTTVTVTVTGAGIAPPIVHALVVSRGQWHGTIGGIPAGTDRTFTLSARNSAGTELYHGETTGITTAPGAIAKLIINGQEVSPAPPHQNATPVIDALLLSSLAVAAGEPVKLEVRAYDPDPGDTLSYAYEVNGQQVSAPDQPSLSWTASVDGTYAIKTRVSDPKQAVAELSVDVAVAASNGRGSAQITASLNTWPVVASVSAAPTRIDAGTTTSLDVVATDSDRDSLSYSWSTDCEGELDSATAKSPTFTLSAVPATKACTFAVTVTDGRGGTNTGSITLAAGPKPPADVAPRILSTFQSDEEAGPGTSVVLRVTAVDPEGTALTFAWERTTGTLSNQVDTWDTSEIVWTAPAPFIGAAEVTAEVTDAGGQTTVNVFRVAAVVPTWHVLTIPDLPADALPVGIWAGAPNDVYMSAYVDADVPTGYVWHWNGTSWSVVLSLPGHQTGEVYGTSSTDVFVASYRCADGSIAGCGADRGGRIFRSTDGGGSFVEQALPSEVGTNSIAHISGTPGNVHAAAGGSTIIRFDGTTWSPNPGSGNQGLAVFSPNEGYSVACWGWSQWNGSAWSYHDQGWDFCDVNYLWGMRDNSGVLHLYAAGNNNWSNGVRVWRFDEASGSFGSKYGYVFGEGDAAYTGSASGIWGAAPDDIYVIGVIKDPPRSGPVVLGEGRVYHYDGTSWSRVTAVPDIITPTAISGSAADNVWVTMSDGRLLRYGP